MAVYVPCLNVQSYDDGGGFSVGIGVGEGITSDAIGSGQFAPGVTITHSDSPVAVTVIPIPPYIIFGPNFEFWKNLFGLGQTKIERQKIEIQDFYTPIFRYLSRTYGVPIRDNHALQFPSDGVKRLLADNPLIAALEPGFTALAPGIVTGAFGYDKSASGIEERIVRQFLANAAYNGWPVSATEQIFAGIYEASLASCKQDAARWMRDPLFVSTAAKYAVLLQYVPLAELAQAAAGYGVEDPLGAAIVLHWAANPSLVGGIQLIAPRPSWAGPYTNWSPEQGGPPPLQEFTAYDRRPEVQQLFAQVRIPAPRYPDFSTLRLTGVAPFNVLDLPGITYQQPTPLPPGQVLEIPVPQPSPPVQAIPLPPPQVLEIPVPQRQEPRVLPPGQVLNLPGFIPSVDSWSVPLTPWQVLEIPPVNPSDPLPQVPPGCPPFPQAPTPPPPGQPPLEIPPDQQDLPHWPDPQEPTPCPPECLYQIQEIRRRQEDCCDDLYGTVLPRLGNLETWIRDLEERVPGPQPPEVFEPPVVPPTFPPPAPPPPIPPEIEPPIVPPSIPPEIEDRLRDLERCCDPAAEEERHKQLERGLECLKIDLCALGEAAAGKLAECWLEARTPLATDLEGVHTGRTYPLDSRSPFRAVLDAAYADQVSNQGATVSRQAWPTTLPSPGNIAESVVFVAQYFRASLDTDIYEVPAAVSDELYDEGGIFARDGDGQLSSLNIRQAGLREGESDPCAVTEIAGG